MPVEHDITQYRIDLVLVRAFSNRIETLRPLVPAMLSASETVRPGEIKRVGS